MLSPTGNLMVVNKFKIKMLYAYLCVRLYINVSVMTCGNHNVSHRSRPDIILCLQKSEKHIIKILMRVDKFTFNVNRLKIVSFF